jgi:hypothetical protein
MTFRVQYPVIAAVVMGLAILNLGREKGENQMFKIVSTRDQS